VNDLPAGYQVSHHESRGYDSPDRWYEASCPGWKKECDSPLQAIHACQEHAKQVDLYGKLLATANLRYEAGTGPWGKDADLDQADLAFLETMAQSYSTLSDERGLLSGVVARLIDEVRRARTWPTPANGPGA